ncbi:MAG: WecB/TagA/CpsF family glycosyltransferase [Calditrichaeota bacterium]|nr:WecB/TagA/CpsF family glycosyltransferase [Calditrichota bacterium]
MKVPNPTSVCDLRLYPFSNSEEIIRYVEEKKTILIAIGVEKLLIDDQSFKNIVNRNTAFCDGIGAVWALRRKGTHSKKIPGALLWLDIVRSFSPAKIFYLLGATKDILNATVKKLEAEYPINICGSHHGYFTDKEYESIKCSILATKPDVILVALGSPKQEFVMDTLFRSHPALYMGLGGSFDLYTGKAKPVPSWWIRIFKWEGLYRQVYDLKNMKRWKRQFKAFFRAYRLLR